MAGGGVCTRNNTEEQESHLEDQGHSPGNTETGRETQSQGKVGGVLAARCGRVCNVPATGTDKRGDKLGKNNRGSHMSREKEDFTAEVS